MIDLLILLVGHTAVLSGSKCEVGKEKDEREGARKRTPKEVFNILTIELYRSENGDMFEVFEWL